MSGKSFMNSVKVSGFGQAVSSRLPAKPKLVWAADILIAILLIVFPFIMGGREAWGHRTLITLAMLLG
ncbi:MAG: hypothetical protein ACK58L_12585, partial [Planctomycetota bacterium]